jgi:phage tail sheath protein FI
MPEYLAPGIFVEEIDSGPKPIEGVGTNTAAFIGYAKSGEFNKPIFITSWTDFCRIFCEEDEIVLRALSKELGKSTVELLSAKRNARRGLMEFAQRSILDALDVKKKGGTSSISVQSWPQFIKDYNIPLGMQAYSEDSYLAYAVRGYYDNGGGRAYIVRVARQADLELFKETGHATKALTGGQKAETSIGGITIRALTAGKSGNDIQVEVAHSGDGFTMKVTEGDKTENFGSAKTPLEPGTLSSVKSKIIETPTATATAERPDAKTFNLSGGVDGTAGANLPALLPLHADLARTTPEEFVGDDAKRTGLGALTALEDVNMICVPDLMAGIFRREQIDGADVGPEVIVMDEQRKTQILDVQNMLIAYCERMGDRMCILDPLPGLNPQEMRDTTLDRLGGCDHGQAAVYYPWIRVIDEINKKNGKRYQTHCPPCGHVAGVWARVVNERGVHKAPANETLMGAMALEWDVSKGEQEILNPNGVNCIRSFPGLGIRIWGARTLATVGNPSWKYVNVRRLFNYLERSMERGLQWVVFEPNDHDLWARVRRNISAFLLTEWREGKLFGQTPESAYYVKCDAETNPQEMIDLGRLYVEVGVNPVKPAEFVIIRMGQWTGGAEKSES